MREFLLVILFALPLFAHSQELPYVVFNEINSDNPGGPDTAEFIELYGSPTESLDSIVIVFYDGNTGTSYAAIDLDGYAFDVDGFFVIGNTNAVNVDLIVSNAFIQNGQDAVALYRAEAVDFPNATLLTTTNLIDAVVYGTGDATAANLITGLGLDILIPGYIQLDETVQTTGNDLSLSRLPDGGIVFEESTFVLQEITPGTWNQPPCFGGGISLPDQTTSITLCDIQSSSVIHYSSDNVVLGDSIGYVLVNDTDNIIAVTFEDSLDFTELSAGSYSIYAFAFNGILNLSSAIAGLPLSGLTDDECFSLSDNAISVTITSCGGCVGGTISADDNSVNFAGCAGNTQFISLVNTSTSIDAQYLYVISDNSNFITDQFTQEYDLSTLPAGNYSITGLSYSGDINPLSIVVGADASLITSSICVDYSSNVLAINLYECVAIDPCTELFFSEYLEGNNGTKALEIFNPTLLAIDLNGYSVMNYSNGATAASNTLLLSGSIGALETYVIANPGTGTGATQADPEVLALADITSVVANNSGNDAIELRHNDFVIDVIGIVGEDPGNQSGWAVDSGSTRNNDLVRKMVVQSPVDIWDLSALQWEVYINTDYTHLGNHQFNTCSDTVLAGISGGDFVVNENVGSVSVNIQALNVQSPITLTISLAGGSADLSDFTATLPQDFTFDGTISNQFFYLDIIDDIMAESDETILLTLSTNDGVAWLTESVAITILANDPNCAGGTLTAGSNPVSQCSDITNTPVDVATDSGMPFANYLYVVTDANDNIAYTAATTPIDLDALGEGQFHIWGLSYTGTLEASTMLPNQPVLNIISDTCASLSSNFILVIRATCIITGCDAGSITLNDGATFVTICSDDNQDLISLTTDGQSADDAYTYFITDVNDNIVSETSEAFDANLLGQGNYHIWGISYQGVLLSTSTESGQPIGGVNSDICAEISLDFVEIYVADCSSVPTCALLYFSEYIEDSQSNKALEMYNPTDLDINLADYTIQMYSNGAVTPTNTLLCAGILVSHDVYTIVSSGNGQNPTDQILLDAADTLHTVSTFSSNDAIALLYQGNTIDMIGVIGEDPGLVGWQFGNSSTANHVLLRRPEIAAPNPDWTIVSGQWITYGPTEYNFLGWHAANFCEAASLPVIGFTTVSQTVFESSGAITIEVNATDVATPISVTVDVSGTATNGIDYNAFFPVMLTFPEGNSTQTFEIIVVDDVIMEGDETIVMTLSCNDIVTYANTGITFNLAEEVGVAEQEKITVKVFPNPANESMQVQSIHGINFWRIRDMSGRVISSDFSSGRSLVKIETNQLARGKYLLEIISNDKVEKIPFAILR